MEQSVNSNSSLPSELIDFALKQSDRGRGELAALLLESLDRETDDDELVQAEWSDEFARRIEEIESGKVQLVDGRASLRRLREELRQRHGI
jgi:hypothetical protein